MTSPVAPYPLNDLPAAVEWIHDITGTNRDVVSLRLRQEHARLGSNLEDEMQRNGVESFKYTSELAALYATTDSFLYETYTWNRYASKQKMRKWIIDFLHKRRGTPQRILAFGDGLGFDAAGLALAGHRLTYFEVGQRSIAFASRVFEANNVQVEVCSTPENLPLDDFDVVMCLDVLEHVPEPESVVKKITRHVKPGGFFIVHAPFWYLHPNVRTHLATNKKYSGDWKKLYRPAGLTPVDGELAWNPLVLVKDQSDGFRAGGLKFRCGQAILTFSRYWNWPLITISQAIIRGERNALLKSSGGLHGNWCG